MSELLMCVPLYDVRDSPTGTDLKFLGTGTLIRFASRFLMLTAAHVTERVDVLAIAGFNPPLLIKKPVRDFNDMTTKLDIDVINLENTISCFRYSVFNPIDWNSLMLDVKTRCPPPLCRIVGYPAHNNAARQETQNLTCNLAEVDVREDPQTVLHAQTREIATNREWYIGLRYDPRLLGKQKKKGPKVKAFNGFSGGAIWCYETDGLLKFVGIVTECHSPKPMRTGERIIFGIRAQVIDAFLKERFAN